MQDLLAGGGVFALCLAGAVLLVIIFILASAIRVVPEYQRLVVFRLGRCVGSARSWHRFADPDHRPGRSR